jgi:hypothetical protein
VAVQLFVLGLYLPPVFNGIKSLSPPHTIISVPLHTAVWNSRSAGTLTVLVGVQLFVVGLYRPPVFKSLEPSVPPQTIISLPVQTAV